MEQQLKQRLVGAVVLTAVAVIFIPMLLTGPKPGGRVQLPIEIPPRPELGAVPPLPEERPLPSLPQPVERGAPVYGSEAEAADPEDRAEPAPVVGEESPAEVAAPPAPADQPLASWAVQVGGFSKKANALGLRDRLREAGFTVYVDSIDWKAGKLYRVRVGPVLSREEADQLVGRLQQAHGLKGLVVSP